MDGKDIESWSSSSSIPCSYPPLLHPDQPETAPTPTKKACIRWFSIAASGVLLLCVVALLSNAGSRTSLPGNNGGSQLTRHRRSRGPAEGVSEKSASWRLRTVPVFPWTKSMLLWQRTAFHFQPEKNWINDPDGPLYYKGWYHLFYQYNPDSAVWGNITWGHAVSRDLVHWLYLPIAMVPDRWYDANGVWTGSATFLPDGRIAMLYTGSTTESVQVQNLAFPADLNDPLLLRWAKSEANPVLIPPPGIGLTDFRDPTTAWYVPSESAWLLAIGSKNDSMYHAGIALVYKTNDFLTYELLPGILHAVQGTGMWECVDFYPVSTEKAEGLDTSEPAGPTVKHVLKASMDDDRNDYYAIGTYEVGMSQWVPDDPEKDVGIGLRYDYGKYYASKTFYDPVKKRRVLWSWIGESDSERTDLKKGWASLLGIPRAILFDQKTGSNLLQWPVDDVDELRMNSSDFTDINLAAGAVVPLDVGRATQLDIVAEFEIAPSALAAAVTEADVGTVGYNCSTSQGAAGRGILGPFGLLVLADEDRSEQTAVYFYIGRRADGSPITHFCHDEIRSSKASDLEKKLYGSIVPVLDGETLSVRILVDHSIVESFAQGGRTCITSRVYPTKAIYGAARLFLFNNATNADVTVKSVQIWHMDSAFMRPFDDHDDDGSSGHRLTHYLWLDLIIYLFTILILQLIE